MKVTSSLALMLTTSILCSTMASAAKVNYNQGKFKKINVCAPHLDNVQDIKSELSSLSNNKIIQAINSLEDDISERNNKINSLKDRANTIRTNKRDKERRLKLLTENMSELLSDIAKAINVEKANVIKFQAERDHNQMKKDQCSGGLKGTFCRKKYRSRISDAEKKRDQAKARIASHEKRKKALPAEKKALPKTISSLQAQLVKTTDELSRVENLSPSVAKMESQLDRLQKQNQKQAQLKMKTEERLDLAQMTLDKCRNQRFQSNVYEVVMEQTQVFRERPALCNEVEYLIDTADKDYQKVGIGNAANMVCDMALELLELSVDEDNGDVAAEDKVIYLDQVVRSPEGVNGNYQDNFRTSDKQPITIETVGQSGISMIRFNVEFDIEKNYDYLLIKDAEGNVVEKIDGEGEKSIEVESSGIEILFYSDGNTAKRGFTISDIELHR